MTSYSNMKYFRIILTAIVTIIPSLTIFADVQFTAQGPNTVVVEQPFQIHYSINDKGRDIRLPELKDFEILAGPFTSTSSSMSLVNGQMTSSYEQRYTYTLMAHHDGTFTVPAAHITVSGTQYTSNGLKIKVLPADEGAANASQQQRQAQNSQQQQGAAQTSQNTNQYNAEVANDNIFIRTSLSKTKVKEQECVLLTYKLYSLVDVLQFTASDIPDFTGFVKQEIELSRNAQLQQEHYKGRNYITATLYQTLLYPQHSGTLEIKPATFDAVIRVRNRAQARSIFDSFFDSYVNVNKTLKAPGAKINVEALPTPKPANYSGGVGTFNVKSEISSTELQTNDAVTIKITISGTGNLKLIKTPIIDFPADFEVYDPKVTNNFQTTSQGISGNKTIEYLAIPRSSGQYSVKGIKFAYYDTQSGTYKTLTTPDYEINVAPSATQEGQGTVTSYVNQKEDIKQLGNDIRYIHTAALNIKPVDNQLLNTLAAWLMFLIPLLIALIAAIMLRKYIKDISDIGRMKNKKANKVARKRLKVAQKYAKDDDKEHFYNEILRASWTYVSDKLNIPTSQLNKDNVSQALANRGAEQQQIDDFLNILATAEFARFAPSDSHSSMEELYKRTANLISELESTIK